MRNRDEEQNPLQSLRLDNRVLKAYNEDLRAKNQMLEVKVENKDKALQFAKEILMANGIRESVFERIRQIENGISPKTIERQHSQTQLPGSPKWSYLKT